jgi:hypothetical protein
MSDWKFRGFVEEAAKALEEAGTGTLTDEQHRFLTEGFNDARDRMTTLATHVGTAGSFILVLVALLVGFAAQTDAQSDKLIEATNKQTALFRGCTESATPQTCARAKIDEAEADVTRAQTRLNRLGDLNQAQAVTAGLVVLGFLLGLAALLTNPVPGPNAAKKDADGITAWRRALERLKTKRHWIIASLVAQLLAVASIGYLAADIFTA